MGRVNVRGGEDGRVVATVEYNSDLDFWDGHNWTCGETGRHLGITKLKKSGQYVLIHGTQWVGERSYADLATDEEALQAILSTGHAKLLEEEKFSRLKELYESKMDSD